MYNQSRRDFIKKGIASSFAFSMSGKVYAQENPPKPEMPKGKADACIFLWLGGGACHIDMFDPKPRRVAARQ